MVSIGNLSPSSRVCDVNVATEYKFGVSTASTPSFDRRNKGVDTDINVGSVACKIVTGAIQNGSVHDDRDLRVDAIDRGGCVEGVRISFVRAISRGARMIPAIPAAETVTARDISGDGEDRISSPPTLVKGEDNWSERPGSGRARRADRNDRAKEVIVERSIEWT